MNEEEWTWERHTFEVEGTTYTEWRGSHPYRSAVVSNFANAGGWQARIGEQYSPYYRTHTAGKAWCERYGKPRTRGRRASR